MGRNESRLAGRRVFGIKGGDEEKEKAVVIVGSSKVATTDPTRRRAPRRLNIVLISSARAMQIYW